MNNTPIEGPLFAVGFLVTKAASNHSILNAFIVRAQSHEEAIGKSVIMVQRSFPPAEGWTHHIHVGTQNFVIDDVNETVETG